MLKVSTRGEQMPESPIRRLSIYAEATNSKGIKIYHLNIGQPDIKTPPQAIAAVKDSDIEILKYTQSNGLLALRQVIAAYYNHHKLSVTPSEILVTTGASEAIFFLMNSIADPGDEVIIPEPFYANYLGFTTASEIKIKPIVSSIENNFAPPSIADFESQITPKTRAILICNPGNPTGCVYTKEQIIALVNIAKKHNIYLISDEVYRDFIYDKQDFYSILEAPDFEHHAVVLDSVSKRFSMCGARVGNVVTKNKTLMGVLLKFAQARLCTPIYGQLASIAAYQLPQSFYDEVLTEYRQRRDTLVKALEQIPDIKISYPDGAFYCMVELPVEDTDDFAKWLLKDFSYQNQTVMVAPASGFYIDHERGKKQVRIAYVLNQEDLVTAVNILKIGLKEYQNK